MFLGGHHAEGSERKSEAQKPTVRELKSASEVKDAVSQLGGNKLNEKTFIEKLGSQKDTWLEGLQTSIDEREVFPLEISEGGTLIGFVLADSEGTITQLRSAEGKEEWVIARALYALKDKGFDHPTVRLKERSEHMRRILHHQGFEHHESEDGEEQDGKIGMKKD